MSKWRCS